MTKAKLKRAKLEAVLLDVGIPIIALLKRNAGKGSSYFIASALPDDEGGVESYFAVSVLPKTLKRYLRDQCDLRFLFVFAPSRSFYTIKADAIYNETLELVEYGGEVTERHLPDAQFFASAHNCDYGVDAIESDGQVLYIDGEWQMPEFGEFYQKYADLYAFDSSIAQLLSSSTSQSQINRLTSAFRSKPFKGGSSYLGLFGDLVDAMPFEQRPMLERIAYASPGTVEIRGRDNIFKSVQHNIDNFLVNFEEIRRTHDSVRKFMSDAKLLSITGGSPSVTIDQRIFLETNIKLLYSQMEIDAFSVVNKISEGNLVVTGKIALALYRRLASAANYFAQGRMAYNRLSN